MSMKRVGCSICGLNVDDSKGDILLRMHINQQHFSSYKPYDCVNCGFRFGDPKLISAVKVVCCSELNEQTVRRPAGDDRNVLTERLFDVIVNHSKAIADGHEAEVVDHLDRVISIFNEASTEESETETLENLLDLEEVIADEEQSECGLEEDITVSELPEEHELSLSSIALVQSSSASLTDQVDCGVCHETVKSNDRAKRAHALRRHSQLNIDQMNEDQIDAEERRLVVVCFEDGNSPKLLSNTATSLNTTTPLSQLPFLCRISECGRSYATGNELVVHAFETHLDFDLDKCKHCITEDKADAFTCRMKSQLEEHTRFVHPNRPFPKSLPLMLSESHRSRWLQVLRCLISRSGIDGDAVLSVISGADGFREDVLLAKNT